MPYDGPPPTNSWDRAGMRGDQSGAWSFDIIPPTNEAEGTPSPQSQHSTQEEYFAARQAEADYILTRDRLGQQTPPLAGRRFRLPHIGTPTTPSNTPKTYPKTFPGEEEISIRGRHEGEPLTEDQLAILEAEEQRNTYAAERRHAAELQREAIRQRDAAQVTTEQQTNEASKTGRLRGILSAILYKPAK